MHVLDICWNIIPGNIVTYIATVWYMVCSMWSDFAYENGNWVWALKFQNQGYEWMHCIHILAGGWQVGMYDIFVAVGIKMLFLKEWFPNPLGLKDW